MGSGCMGPLLINLWVCLFVWNHTFLETVGALSMGACNEFPFGVLGRILYDLAPNLFVLFA